MKRKLFLITILVLLTVACGASAAAMSSTSQATLAINEGTTSQCGGVQVKLELVKNESGEIQKYENGSLDVILTVGKNEPKTLKPNQTTTLDGIIFANFTNPPDFRLNVSCP